MDAVCTTLAAKIADLTAQNNALVQAHHAAITVMEDAHRAATTAQNDAHRAAITALNDAHRQELSILRDGHRAEMNVQKNEHDAKYRAVNTSIVGVLKTLNEPGQPAVP